jgi:hypothetical protein
LLQGNFVGSKWIFTDYLAYKYIKLMPCLPSSWGTPFGFYLLLCMFGLPYSCWFVFLTPMVPGAQYNGTLALPCLWSFVHRFVLWSKPYRPSFTTLNPSCIDSSLALLHRQSTTSVHPTHHCTMHSIWHDMTLTWNLTYEMWTQPKKSQNHSSLVSVIHHAQMRSRHFSTWSL